MVFGQRLFQRIESLTLCCSLTCRSPRAHHLPHSLFLLPRHQNTHYNRDNTIHSKNTQCIINLSKTSQSTSSAIKNHSDVKTCRVAEARAKHCPQVMSPGVPGSGSEDLDYARAVAINKNGTTSLPTWTNHRIQLCPALAGVRL